MKPTELRILAVLYHTPLDKHYCAWIASKLDIAPQNISSTLHSMQNKLWITSFLKKKRFYSFNSKYIPVVEEIDRKISNLRKQDKLSGQMVLCI